MTQGSNGRADAGRVLRLAGVTRRYGGVRAVDDVSLEVGHGERHVIIGPNGAGKTTLFKLISRLERVSAGRIELFGTDITRMAPHRVARLGLARTYQITKVFPQLAALENVMLAVQGLQRSKFRMLRPAMRQRSVVAKARATLERVGLSEAEDVPAAALGHGQQRQLDLGLALAGEPRVLLLDEPAAGLAGSERHMIRDLIRGLADDITVLLIEHDMELAFGLADRVTCLHEGAEVATGTPDQIKEDERVQSIYLGGEGD
jgi:branched-chain amino acid transport system ATP-binding protein